MFDQRLRICLIVIFKVFAFIFFNFVFVVTAPNDTLIGDSILYAKSEGGGGSRETECLGNWKFG